MKLVDVSCLSVAAQQSIDERAVEQFEALVLSQQPASTPWQPVIDYSFEARREIEGRHPELIRDVFSLACQKTPTLLTVGDIGCGPGHLVTLLRALRVNAFGVDRLEYMEWVKPEGTIFWLADLAEPGSCENDLPQFEPDVIMCREVLEHLTARQIAQAVQTLCTLSQRFVYVTTRFAQAPNHLLSVDTADELDPSHITMLTKPFLRTLFILHGFRSRPDLETLMDWQHKGRCLVMEKVVS